MPKRKLWNTMDFRKFLMSLQAEKSAMTRCIRESAHWKVLIMFIFMMARGRLSIMHFCAAPGYRRTISCLCSRNTSKDTIKLINEQGFVTRDTRERKYTWIIQTPQVFEYTLIRGAYEQMYQNMPAVQITDDAMVVETMLCTPVKVV